MLDLIEKLVTTAVSKVPADIRQAEANSLRASMQKAREMLCFGQLVEDTAWTERVLRRMAEQYTVWQGQNSTHRAGKR
jgi:hypothetical protein